MKTNQYQQRIKNAKLAHMNNQMQTTFVDGILTRHLYSEQQRETLSWWDDFGFIINDYRVSVAWCHPRQAFRDFIETEAIEMVLKRSPEVARTNENLEAMQKPIYRKVGRSRKKVKWFEHVSVSDDDYLVKLREVERDLEESTEHIVLPSLDIRWTNRSRFVFACIPLEIHNESDLRSLASVIKRLIRREASLQELFPGYRYTRYDWEAEKENRGAKEFHVHGMRI